jgi:hypothetical protein
MFHSFAFVAQNLACLFCAFAGGMSLLPTLCIMFAGVQESGEHMPEKERFVGELCRVAAPGELRLRMGVEIETGWSIILHCQA